MNQLKVHDELKCDIDFNRPGIPYTAAALQPTVFKEHEKYFCAWGDKLETAIIGTGDTPEAAVQDWDYQLTSRLNDPGGTDELVNRARAELNQSTNKVKDGGENAPPLRESPPNTVSQEILDDAETGTSKQNDLGARKSTTDQANADGSEFR